MVLKSISQQTLPILVINYNEYLVNFDELKFYNNNRTSVSTRLII